MKDRIAKPGMNPAPDQRDPAAPTVPDEAGGFLALFVEALPNAVLVKDEQHRFVFVNEAFSRLMGRTVQELLGKSDFDFVPAAEARTFWENDDLVLATGLARENEEPLTDADGVEHRLLTRKSRVITPGGQRYVVVTITDITARVTAEQALKQSEERYRNLIEGSIQGILVHDDGRPLFVNHAFASIYGYDSPAEMLALKTLDVLIAPEDVDRMLSYRAARLQGAPAPASYEHRGIRRDGTMIWLEQRSRVIYWNGQRAIQAVIVDISERKRAEQALVAARDEAAAASRSKSEFLANVSHELRTPLNAVIGFSEILRREQLGPLGSGRYREFAEDIHDSGLHMLDLINDILDLSKIEAGRFELHDEVVGVADLLEAVRRLVHERAERSRLALAVEIGEIPPRVRVDVRAVRQVLFNLLSNAIKFTPEGGRVTLLAMLDPGGGLRLEVRDTGVGVAAADIPKAMEPFGQVNNALTRRHQGAGLGLPISRALVELHRGRFLFASEPGVGTIVTVLLPADRVAA